MAALYIHIPFCKTRCNYCDFYKSTSCAKTEDYIEALEREMEYRRGYFGDTPVDTVFFGGGTPSLLPPALLQRLIDKGLAYESQGDVYYRVRAFPSYGCLCGQNLEDLESGARVSVDEVKEDPLDFALWKGAKPGEPAWDCPWGKGRPGWHIECSAMSMELLGPTFDIHAGGQDLIFPHHENEIAQSEAATGKPFARYWMHNGYINVDNQKMSKSLGNFRLVRDIAQEFDLEAVRLFLLSAQYRNPINFTRELIEQANTALTLSLIHI